MLTSEQIRAALTKAEVPEANLDKATLAVVDLMMAEEQGEPAAPDSSTPETPAAAPEDQMAYSKDPVILALQKQTEAQSKELAELRKIQQQAARKAKDELFESYERKGKLRYADKKEARQLLDGPNGDANFISAYGRVPELTEQPAPTAPKDQKSSASLGAPVPPPPQRSNKPRMNDDLDAKIQAYSRENKVDYLTAARIVGQSS